MHDMAHSYVWRVSFICMIWLLRIRYMARFICVTWLIHTYVRDMTHSYVWDDCLIYVIGLISYVGHDWSNVWHVSFICVTWIIHPRVTPVEGPVFRPLSTRLIEGFHFEDCLISRFYFVPNPSNVVSQVLLCARSFHTLNAMWYNVVQCGAVCCVVSTE